jgi:hypothetical protein
MITTSTTTLYPTQSPKKSFFLIFDFFLFYIIIMMFLVIYFGFIINKIIKYNRKAELTIAKLNNILSEVKQQIIQSERRAINAERELLLLKNK